MLQRRTYTVYLLSLQKGRIRDAAHRYHYALKKFPKDGFGGDVKTFRELKLNLLLSLSRCKRKLEVCTGVTFCTKP